MLDFLDIFGSARADHRREASAIRMALRAIGIACLVILFLATIAILL
ncbi:hypothetical protein K3148_09820 [Qipengyuania aurantiaca]|uniref:Uncharacterized protein n=1 Tax=Qipengyuania aurantiaca TaxID=2867233 RepID=A0ABX8ZPM1_9SPHN|nr:hypothetical protein [Qipengyuania aurantiaca]QZD89133.1 hypothetical protein K3148_09820 [Qipengyuania aurantiaca]